MRPRVFLGTLSLIVAFLILPMLQAADAAVLCTNPGGIVFMRDAACRPGEQLVDVASLGLTPNDAYTIHRHGLVTLASDGRIVAVVTVPPGKYLVNAWVGFVALDATADQVVACYLPTGTGDFDAADANTGNHGNGTLAFHSTFVATETTAIIMECRTPFNFLTAAVREVRLTAVRVNSVTTP